MTCSLPIMDLKVFTYRQKVSSGLIAHESYWLLTKSALKMSVCCSETKWTVFEILVVEHSWTIKNKWINSREGTQTGNGTISDVSPTIKFLYFSDCVVWKLLIVIPGRGRGGAGGERDCNAPVKWNFNIPSLARCLRAVFDPRWIAVTA